MTGPVNLKAVAERAGVSLATASRVISRSDYPVREELRERVLAAAAELDYVPNAQARGLLQGNPLTVGVLIPSMGPHVNTFLEKLHERLDPYGYMLTTITTRADMEQTIRAITTLQAHRTGTVIFADGGVPMSSATDRLVQRVQSMKSSGHTMVLVAEETQLDLPLVKVPYSTVGAMSAQWLIDNGHREVGVIAEGTGYIGTNKAAEAFHKTAEGITVHRVDVATLTDVRAEGRAAAHQLLDEHPNITAIVGEVDDMAIGALYAARERGIDVPGELSILGRYDVPAAADHDLTSVGISQDEVARQALRVARMVRNNELPESRIGAEVSAEWVERGTTGPARR